MSPLAVHVRADRHPDAQRQGERGQHQIHDQGALEVERAVDDGVLDRLVRDDDLRRVGEGQIERGDGGVSE